jgi:hypothetical protein
MDIVSIGHTKGTILLNRSIDIVTIMFLMNISEFEYIQRDGIRFYKTCIVYRITDDEILDMHTHSNRGST